MSAENAALVRGLYESFGRGDIPQVLSAFDPEIEWVESDDPVIPYHGTHRGLDAVANEVFGTVMTYFDEFTVVPLHVYDAGDHIIVEGRAKGTTKAGRKLDAPHAGVWTVRQGKVVRMVNYHDTNAWRQALSA
jgi:uncharacterized protein